MATAATTRATTRKSHQRRRAFSDLWRATTKGAGLEGVRYHDLRHYYASVLLSSGVNIKAVQTNLGHGSAKVTLDTYGHFMRDDEGPHPSGHRPELRSC